MGISSRTTSAGMASDKTLYAPIEGYAAIFNTPDETGDSIAPTAFDDFFLGIVIPAAEPRVSMLYQHKVDCPIGCWNAFRADKKGLFVRGVLLLGSSKAKDVLALVKGGALNGLSIGFRAQSFTRRADGGRHILKAQLWEVSIVTFPMASQARISSIGGATTDRSSAA
ncbi:MAG: HK97 family phage prohead protease [Pseudomonadota bacterium]